MKKLLFILLMTFLLGISVNAQTDSTAAKPSPMPAAQTADAKPKRQIFRAKKDVSKN